MELRYKVIGYADNSKPAITFMAEFTLVDRAPTTFENASGCKNMKCIFLPWEDVGTLYSRRTYPVTI